MTYRRSKCSQLIVLTLFITTLCMIAGFVALKTAIPVQADDERLGSLSGVVRNQAGSPVAGINVTLSGNSVIGSNAQTVESDAAGEYRFGGLPAGSYTVRLEDPAARYPSPQYYEAAIGRDDATPIPVTGEDITGFDLTIFPGGEMSGQVTDEAGTPLTNVKIFTYSRYGSADVEREAVTDLNGRYVITGMAAGLYRLQFVDRDQQHFGIFYGGATSYSDAAYVGVSANGRVDNLNVQLRKGGSVSGRVMGSDGLPLGGIRVEAMENYYYTLRAVRSTLSKPDGTYTLGALEAGDYIISFEDPTERYAPQAYVNFLFQGFVPVGEDTNVTGIDVIMTRRGAMEGTVTNEAGQPVADAQIRAIPPDDGNFNTRTARTDAQGVYHLDGLSAVEYALEFSTPDSFYQREYYSNVVSIDAAIPLTVAPGAILTNINASLAVGAAISGVISHVDDVPLSYLSISAYPQSTPLTPTISVITRVLGSHYTYTLGGLPLEPHIVKVQALGNTEYSGNTSVLERAVPVPIVAGAVIPNVDFLLGDGADTGTISGTVRSSTGEPLENAAADLYCFSPCGEMIVEEAEAIELPLSGAGGEPTWNYLRSTNTDEAGGYMFTGLPPRPYRLRFRDIEQQDNLAFEYYDDAIDLAAATEIDLQPFMVRENVDATLTTGAVITGVVTLDGGYPLRSTRVQLYVWDGYQWSFVSGGTTSYVTGSYVLSGLQTGRYRLASSGYFENESYQYFYGNTSVLTEAIDINVTAGVTTTDINIQVPADAFLNAAFTGTVTADGQPLPNIRVELYRYGALVQQTTTDNNGHYVAGNLAANTYGIVFVDPSRIYALGYTEAYTTFSDIYYGGIRIGTNRVITNVNHEMVRGGAIEGRVTDETGNGIASAVVQPYILIDGEWERATPPIRSESDGRYQTPALRPGDYLLYFSDPYSRYPARYLGNHATNRYAPKIEITAGQTFTGVDIVMSGQLPYRSFVFLPVVAR